MSAAAAAAAVAAAAELRREKNWLIGRNSLVYPRHEVAWQMNITLGKQRYQERKFTDRHFHPGTFA